jgi:hypothetical protein
VGAQLGRCAKPSSGIRAGGEPVAQAGLHAKEKLPQALTDATLLRHGSTLFLRR